MTFTSARKLNVTAGSRRRRARRDGRAGAAFGRLRIHYAEVARRWQAAGNLPASAVPQQVGAAMLGLTQGFLLQHLLIPDTTIDAYTAGVQALLTASTAEQGRTA